MKPSIAFRGRGGAGKSYRVRKFTRQHCTPDDFLLLVYNAANALLARDNKFFTKSNTMTIHAACYHALRACGLLPARFKVAHGLPVTDLDWECLRDEGFALRKEDFDALLDAFLSLSLAQIRKVFGHIELLAIDEVQDLDPKLLAVVQHLHAAYNPCAVVLAGDHYQRINDFSRKPLFTSGDTVLRLAELFGIETVVTLTISWRSSPAICLFLNGYYKRAFKAFDPAYEYDVDLSQLTAFEKPEVHLFQNTDEMVNFVQEEAQDAVVLSRRKEIRNLISDKDDPNDERNCTIHHSKGSEANTVFVADVSLNENASMAERMIYGVAFSRAKQKLVIVTSCPRAQILAFFDPDTFQLHDHTTWRERIRKSKSVTTIEFEGLPRYNGSIIDSIGFRIPQPAVPFRPHIEHHAFQKHATSNKSHPRPASRQILKSHDGSIEFTVSRFHRTGHYDFDFLELSPLRFSGFNDKEIVQYCHNEILRFFDERVRKHSIQIVKLHLGKVHKFRSLKKREEFLLGLRNLLEAKRADKRMSNGAFSTQALTRLDNTTYYNCLKPYGKRSPLVACLYDPSLKENYPFPRNAIWAKVEQRLNKREIVQQARFLRDYSNMKTFLRLLRKAPKSWYKLMIQVFWGFDLFAKP